MALSNSISVEAFFLQYLEKPNPKYYIGSGKVEEMRAFVLQHSCQLVICDNELKSSQIRNLRKKLKCDVIDRSELILDIFASRTKSREGQIQIQIARLKYELSRLRHLWTHFGRIQGKAFNKGMGETQLEVDRRRTRAKISRLEKQMKEIFRHKNISMKKRNSVFSVALVGYANAGKSTLMKALSCAEVIVKNMPFSTLQTTSRKVKIDSFHSFVLSDTVGFVRKLPEHLLSSFYATLMEVKQANLLLHVVDVSSADYLECLSVLKEIFQHILKNEDKKMILVFNKKDSIEDFQAFMSSFDKGFLKKNPFVFISAKKGEGLDILRQMIVEQIDQDYELHSFKCASANGKAIAFINQCAQILDQKSLDSEQELFRIRIQEKDWKILQKYNDIQDNEMPVL